MSDTFHGRSREELIQTIREFDYMVDGLIGVLGSVSDFLEGKISQEELIEIVTAAQSKLEPKP